MCLIVNGTRGCVRWSGFLTGRVVNGLRNPVPYFVCVCLNAFSLTFLRNGPSSAMVSSLNGLCEVVIQRLRRWPGDSGQEEYSEKYCGARKWCQPFSLLRNLWLGSPSRRLCRIIVELFIVIGSAGLCLWSGIRTAADNIGFSDYSAYTHCPK